MMQQLHHWITDSTAYLYVVVYRNDFLFIDYWSFIHLISGFHIVVLAYYKRYSRPFTFLLTILLSWELIEIAFIFVATQVFRPETLPDQLTDIVVGVGGGLLGQRCWQYKRKRLRTVRRRNPMLLTDLSISCAISFFWVASYGYTYNLSFLNSPVVNWWAFALWSSGLFACLCVSRMLDYYIAEHFLVKIALIWILYFSGILIIEYLGYYVLHIRQVTSDGPLLFGLIHGTVILKVYYVIAGICAVVTSKTLGKVLREFGTTRSTWVASRAWSAAGSHPAPPTSCGRGYLPRRLSGVARGQDRAGRSLSL